MKQVNTVDLKSALLESYRFKSDSEQTNTHTIVVMGDITPRFIRDYNRLWITHQYNKADSITCFHKTFAQYSMYSLATMGVTYYFRANGGLCGLH